MSNLKTHFATGAASHGPRETTNVYQVDCRRCMLTPAYSEAKEKADDERHAAFMAQTPSPMEEPWKAGVMVCSSCAGHFFRIGDRTCYGHYANYHCASCGHVESRLTERGMSF